MLGIGLMMGALLSFSLTAWAWETPGYPFALLLPVFRGSVAFTTVALFAVYMKCCWTAAAATQFTLYMALNNIGYTLGTKLPTTEITPSAPTLIIGSVNESSPLKTVRSVVPMMAEH